MEAATTLWYTAAKKFLLVCEWGRGIGPQGIHSTGIHFYIPCMSIFG